MFSMFFFGVSKNQFTDPVVSYLIASGAIAVSLFLLSMLVWISKRWVDAFDEKIKSLSSKEEVALLSKIKYLEGRIDERAEYDKAVMKLFSSIVDLASGQSQEFYASIKRQLLLEIQQLTEDESNESNK